MLFQTPTQFVVLALLLFAGWVFGLASSSAGKKWKQRFHDEEAAHKAYRAEVATDLKSRDARLAEVEAERDRYMKERPITPVAAGSAGILADHDRGHGHTGGFFGWGRDNLSRIHGIDPELERALAERGIKTYAAIEALTEADEHALEADLNLRPGAIHHAHWREQAAMLRTGREDDHRNRWG